jgi:hypothetical protein
VLSRKKVWITIFLVGLIISMFTNNVWGEDLIQYSLSKDGSKLYYDKDSLKRSFGSVRVWTTTILGDKEKIDLASKFSGIGYEKLSQTKILFEINCKDETIRRLSTISYDTSGGIIDTDSKPPDMEDVVSGSHNDLLLKKVCSDDLPSPKTQKTRPDLKFRMGI